MSEYEKNVYTNLFEYPTKHIVKLELENEKKEKEINRLNNEIKILLQENENKEKVIIKQDNIMNELEKWLKMIPKYFMDKRSLNNGVYIEQGMQKQIDLTLDKLKELKDSGNNDK